jgi:hypothetical protein
MNQIKTLDQEEKEILDAYESGKLRGVPEAKKEIARHKGYAQPHLRKTHKSIFAFLQRSEGTSEAGSERRVPYQTLISRVLHKFADGG